VQTGASTALTLTGLIVTAHHSLARARHLLRSKWWFRRRKTADRSDKRENLHLGDDLQHSGPIWLLLSINFKQKKKV
jgi:hypothetical protein